MRIIISFFVAIFLWMSCSVEKPNLSPLSNSLAISQSFKSTTESIDAVNYSSELTNLLSEFPIFSNKTMNSEVYKLKLYITDYLYAIKNNDSKSKNEAYESLKITYKKIHQNKIVLEGDEKELLERFMAKVKTNISLIESQEITE